VIRAVFALLSGVFLYGLAFHREWMHSYWSPTGWERFVLAMSLTAVAVLGLGRACFYAIVLVLACSVGVLAPVSVGFALWGALNLGWLVFRSEDDRLNVLGGFALYVWLFSLTASMAIHTVWLWGALLGIPIAMGRRWTLPLPKPSLPVALPLAAYFLLALKPEISADGLSQHLAAIEWVKDFGRFHFDAANQIWAVQPMNGDWAYTIPALFGGEYAARLLNVVWLLLITSFTFHALRRHLEHTPAALATGVFLSTPVLQVTTTSLFVENFWSVLVCGALFAIEGDSILLAAALLGAAAGTKLLGLIPALGLGGFAAWRVFKKWNWPRAMQALALYVAFAAVPYARAYLLTGNPVFHYANKVFRSPLISTTENFTDLRFPARLNWHTLYDVTFHTNLFAETEPGTAGYQWLFLAPLVVLLFGKLKAMERAAAATALTTVALIFSSQASVRYVVVSMALLTIASGGVIGLLLEDRWLRKVTIGLGLVLFGLNLHAMAGASRYHRDFCLKPFSWRERERYLTASVPERRLIDDANRIAPGATVGFLEGDSIAGLRARAWTATWHTPKFSSSLDAAFTLEQYSRLMQDFGVQYLIAAGPNHSKLAKQGPLRTFLEEATEPVSRNFYLQLVRVKQDFDPAHLKPVGLGEYDDFNTRIVYEGTWYHDDQFSQAANGSISYTPEPNGWLHFDFEGERLTYVYTKAPNRGKGIVEIDGVNQGEYDFMSPVIEWKSKLVYDHLGPGVHRFVLRKKGQGGHVDIDELVVE
jgi:hypothetical protein